jgi:hypothetical protein
MSGPFDGDPIRPASRNLPRAQTDRSIVSTADVASRDAWRSITVNAFRDKERADERLFQGWPGKLNAN